VGETHTSERQRMTILYSPSMSHINVVYDKIHDMRDGFTFHCIQSLNALKMHWIEGPLHYPLHIHIHTHKMHHIRSEVLIA